MFICKGLVSEGEIIPNDRQPCKYCLKTFTKNSLYNHMKLKHLGASLHNTNVKYSDSFEPSINNVSGTLINMSSVQA